MKKNQTKVVGRKKPVEASLPSETLGVAYQVGGSNAVCDFDMHFTYASIGQPGSMHDTSVLFHAIENDKAAFPHPPKG
jgi:hypothetical protein